MSALFSENAKNNINYEMLTNTSADLHNAFALIELIYNERSQ